MRLEPETLHRIPCLNPKGNVSVIFRVIPEKDYIFGIIEGFILYYDLNNKIWMRDIGPYKIEYQQELFTPSKIFVRNLNRF